MSMKKSPSIRLRIFPLNAVLFPAAVLSVHIFEPRYKQMISECLERGEAFGVVLVHEGEEAGAFQTYTYEVGTTAEICDVTPLGNGRFSVSTIGRKRFQIDGVVMREPYLCADVTYFEEETVKDPPGLLELANEVRAAFGEYLHLLVDFIGVRAAIELPGDPQEVSFLIGDTLQIADVMKQRLLEMSNTEQRLTVELDFLRRLLPQLRGVFRRRKSEPTAGEKQSRTYRSDQEHYFGKFFSLN